MSGFKNEVAHLRAHIKALRIGAVALLRIALMMDAGWWSAPRNLTIQGQSVRIVERVRCCAWFRAVPVQMDTNFKPSPLMARAIMASAAAMSMPCP